MLPGPVFAFELLATAWRARFYLIRALYAVVLLLILWAAHGIWKSQVVGELPFYLVNWFAFSTFCAIAIGQESLVLVLTPSLVAGVIADEKQRKTLHYLLASRFCSPEIVLGKLLARMLYVGILLGVSLPVLSLVVLLGGVDPQLVVLACAAISTSWFLAALSIWVSTIARRVREAFFLAYGLEVVWLFSSLILGNVWVPGWQALNTVVGWLAAWIGYSSPVELGRQFAYSLVGNVVAGGRPSWQSLLELVCWMIGLELVCGLVMGLLAAWKLRPIFKRQQNDGRIRPSSGLRSILSSRPRWWFRRRPSTSAERPMLWKELHTDRTSVPAPFVAFLLLLIVAGYLTYWTVWLGTNAFAEAWDNGFGWNSSSMARLDRSKFQLFLQLTLPFLYIMGIIAVAGAAAAAITSEHEDDTWVSLAVTDLTGREIIFSKLLGALKRGLRFAEVILSMAALGVAAGSLHPASVPLLIIALLIYGWFAAALGLWISSHLRSTWRAQFLTIACLVLISTVGQVVLNTFSKSGFAPGLWPGLTPYEIAKLLVRSEFFPRCSSAPWPLSWSLSDVDDGPVWQTIASVLSILGYASLATLLNWQVLRRFELVARRARPRVLPKFAPCAHVTSIDLATARE
jgi:ABC-type transport system involved in multi-copper enzyme maturation permease subunit